MPTPIANQLNYTLPDPIGVDQLKRRNALAERDQVLQEQNAQGYQNQLAMQQQGQQRNWMAQDQASKQQAFAQIGTLAQQALQAGPNARQFVSQALQNPAYAQVFQSAGVNPGQIDLNSPTFEQDLQTWASLGPQKAQQEAYTLTPGQKRFVGGREIASVPLAEPEMTPYQRESLSIERAKLKQAGEKGPTAPSGYRYGPDGSLVAIPGGPADKASEKPKQTESDKKASVLFGSMVNAEKQLAGLKGGADTSSLLQNAMGATEITKSMQSADYKKYEAAGLRWAANLLYSKSGATATPDEIRSTWKQFFPQPGEDAALKQQKAEARNQEMQAVAQAYGLDASQIPQLPKAAGPPGQGQPVQVRSVQEAMALPPGTPFLTPDGRRKVR